MKVSPQVFAVCATAAVLCLILGLPDVFAAIGPRGGDLVSTFIAGAPALAGIGHRRSIFTASADGDEPDDVSIAALAEAFDANSTATATAMTAMRKDLDKLLNTTRPAVARLNGPMTQQSAEVASAARRSAHQAALSKFMSTGDEAHLHVETAAGAMMVQDDPSGGFIVPDEISRDIMNMMRDVSPMRRLATVRETSSSNYGQPVNKGGTNGGWVSETDPRPQTDASKLGLLNVPSCELYAQPAATQKLLDDSFVSVSAWIEGEIVQTFAEIEGVAFVTGNGVERPLGILSIPIVAERDATRAWGKFEYIPTGVGGGFATAPTQVDVLVDLVYRLKAGYRRNATWLMNSATGALVAKFKDANGALIWRESLAAGVPPTLLGYPVEFEENMPDVDTGTFSIAFGDFGRGYLITDRFQTRLLRDPYTAKPYVLFYATKRVGGAPQDTNAIKFLKFAPS